MGSLEFAIFLFSKRFRNCESFIHCFPLVNVGTELILLFIKKIAVFGGPPFEMTWELLILFSVELEKQSYCDLKVANKTEHYVAFKVFLHQTTNFKNDQFIIMVFLLQSDFFFCLFSFTKSGQNNISKEVFCKTQHWCHSAMGLLYH